MTKILNYFHLCPINDEKEFLGLSQDVKKGTILNTLGRNMIISVKLSNQKQINSWTVLDKLSSKVVYDFDSKSYVGVFGSKFIRCWKNDCTDINKVKRIKLAKPIGTLISIPDDKTIVMYTDGTSESLQSAIDARKIKKDLFDTRDKSIIDPENTEFFNPNYFKCADNKLLLTYFTRSNETNEIHLICFMIDDETMKIDGPVHKLRISREENHVKLSGYTVINSAVVPQLVTIWSDGRIFLLPLTNENVKQDDIPGHFVALISTINVEQPISVVGISRDCIAIYGASTTQEGASLVLYNTQFKVIESRQQFKIYFNNSRMWIIDNFIFLAISQTLAVVTFRSSNEQLSDMIGSQRVTDLSKIVDMECINVDGGLEEMIEFDTEDQLNANANDESTEESDNNADFEIIEPFDPRNNPFEDVEKIKKDLYTLQHFDVDVTIERDDEVLANMLRLKISSNANDNGFNNDSVRMLTTELQRMGASEIEISETIIPLLLEANLEDDLVTCLRSYTNVSEKMLVAALKYFLKLIRTESMESRSDDDKITNVHINGLNAALSCSFSTELILDHLRTKLNFEDVLYVLNYIFGALKSDEVRLEERPQIDVHYGDDELLIKWFSTLIDSHFQQFIISRDPKHMKLLNDWKQFIDNLTIEIQDTKTITATFSNLFNGKLIGKESKGSKWYSVEAFKLY